MKISCQFLWNIQNFVLSGKQSVWRKKRHVFGTLQFWPKSLCPDLTGVPFFGWFWVFFEMLKIPFQFFWNIQNFVLSWKQSVWRKKACSGDFSIWTKIAVSGLTGVAIFWLLLSIFGNFENTLPILVKHSKFCSFMKTISFKKKKHVLGTFQFSTKSRYPDVTGVAIFWLILRIFWNDENILPIVVKHSKFCSFMNTVSFKKKKHVLGTFQFLAKSLYPDRTGLAIFCWFWVFFEMLKMPFQFLWNIQNFFSFMKTISFKKKKHILGTFQFSTKSRYPDFTGVAIFWLILRIFWNDENILPILVKHLKFCSFMNTVIFKKKKHVLGTFKFLAKSLYPDRTGVAIFCWFWVFFEMLKMPFQFLWNIQNFVLSWRQSVRRKKGMFWGFFNLDQNLWIRTLPAWPFFGWFWVFFEMLKIPFQFLWNIENFGLSWRQSVSRKKSMFWELFNFRQNRGIRTWPAWPFFVCFWVFFEMMKISCQFLWNNQNFVLLWIQSVTRKKSMFWELFNFRTVPAWPFFGWFWVFFEACFGNFSIYSWQTRCIRTVPAWPFLLILSIFWNVENALPILVKHSKFCSFMKTISLKKKKHILGTFQFWSKIAVSGPYRLGHFLLILSIFWNVENTLPILVKHSKFCSFMKTISLKKKKHVLGTFGHFLLILSIFWNVENTLPTLLKHSKFCSFMKIISLSGPYRCGHSNSSETFKILFFNEDNQFEEKKACFGTFQFWTKIAVSGPYRSLPFFGWFWEFFEMMKIPFQFLWNIQNFVLSLKTVSLKKKKACFRELFNFRTVPASFFGWFWVFFEMLKIPFQFFWNIQNFVLSWRQSVRRKKGIFWGFFNLDQNLWIPTLPAWPFFGWFWVFFEMLKIPFQFFWNIQNFVLSWKQSFSRKKSMFWGLFNFRKIAVSGPYRRGHFLVDFEYFLKWWKYPANSCETFKILFFYEYSHFQEKKPCFGNFSISGPYRCGHFLVDFEYFSKCWKYPSYSCETFKILFFNEDNQFEEKKAMFWGLFILDQNRCIRTLPALPFFGWFWVFSEMLKIPFQFLWDIQNVVLSWKQSVSRKKSMFWGLFNFRQNRCIRTIPAWPFFGWFWVFFEMLKIPFQFLWNIQNFVLSWKQSVWRKKRHVFGNFNFDQNRSVRTVPACHFLVDFEYFLKCWKYHSNSSETFKILFFHEDNQFEEKKACFGDFLIWTKISVSGPYRCGHFLVDFEYFLKCWKYPSNSCETFKILFFHEDNQFQEKKACFGNFSIFGKIAVSGPYRRGHFLFAFEYFLKWWKYPTNSCETFKILFFYEYSQFQEKKACFGNFSIFGKIAVSGPYRLGHFLLILSIFWNVENALPILVKHSKFCSFMKTISLKKKKHVLGTFQFGAKSLYPDLTGVAIFCWFWVFFEMLKIPFQLFWNIQNNQFLTFHFGPKSHVLGTFQF